MSSVTEDEPLRDDFVRRINDIPPTETLSLDKLNSPHPHCTTVHRRAATREKLGLARSGMNTRDIMKMG